MPKAYTIFDYTYDNTQGSDADKEAAAWRAYNNANANYRDRSYDEYQGIQNAFQQKQDEAQKSYDEGNLGFDALQDILAKNKTDNQRKQEKIDAAKTDINRKQDTSPGVGPLSDTMSDDQLLDYWWDSDLSSKPSVVPSFGGPDSSIPTGGNSESKEWERQQSFKHYWDEANKQAVDNAVKSGKLTDRDKVYNQDGSINWGYLDNDIDFWKNKSLGDIYGSNGVTYDSVINTLGQNDIYNINNERFLGDYAPSGNTTDDWYYRNTRSGVKGFDNQDKDLFRAQVGGVESIKDTNPALYEQLQGKKVDNGLLRGQDLAQMEYGYDDTTGKTANGKDLNQLTSWAVDNPINMADMLYNDPSKIFTDLASGSVDSLNNITNKLIQAGYTIKNPNGTFGLIGQDGQSGMPYSVMLNYAKSIDNQNASSMTDEQKEAIKNGQAENASDEDKQKAIGILNQYADAEDKTTTDAGYQQARLNSAILASALANQAPTLQQTGNSIVDYDRLNYINDYLNNKNKGYGYNFGSFTWGDKDTNSPFDLSKIMTLMENEDESGDTIDKSKANGNLNVNAIMNAIKRSGLRRA